MGCWGWLVPTLSDHIPAQPESSPARSNLARFGLGAVPGRRAGAFQGIMMDEPFKDGQTGDLQLSISTFLSHRLQFMGARAKGRILRKGIGDMVDRAKAAHSAPGLIDSSIVRWHALSALNGFDDLDAATAIVNARSEMRALISRLDAVDTPPHTPRCAPQSPAPSPEPA